MADNILRILYDPWTIKTNFFLRGITIMAKQKRKKIPLAIKILASLSLIVVIIIATMQQAVKPEIIAAGELRLGDDLGEFAQGNHTLFIIIYSSDENNRMPLGIIKEPIRITESGLIRRFSITPDKVERMMSRDPIPSNFKLKGRIDRDGMGGPDQPGDIVAITKNINYGSEEVILTFDQKI